MKLNLIYFQKRNGYAIPLIKNIDVKLNSYIDFMKEILALDA